MSGLIAAIPAAEWVHHDHDGDPDRIDAPGRQTAAGCGAAKLEGAEVELAEGIALGKVDDEQQQVDEVEVDDEIEKRDVAVDQENAG